MSVREVASIEIPAVGSRTAPLNIGKLIRSEYTSSSNLLRVGFSESAIEAVLSDTEKRIHPDFRVPREIRNNVGFWLRIYTQFTTRQIAVFDGKHPEVIYEVLDFRDLADKAKNEIVYEVIAEKKIRQTLAAYRTAFAHLAVNPNPKKPTREELRIITALKNTPHRHSIKTHRRWLRTQTGQRDNVIRGLVAAESYFPKMEPIFRGMGLPIELTRLSLVESSFDTNVTSRVGAAGVWQFMPASGREYLLIDKKAKIDERLSPLKGAVAAAKLLKRSFRILRNWALAITSYNHGMRHLRSLAATTARPKPFKQIAHAFATCSPKKSGLGWASRNYYAEFLAIVHAEAYRQVFYGNAPIPAIDPISVVRLNKPMTAVEFAMSQAIPFREFQLLNPDIMDFRKPLPVGFLVATPSRFDDLSLLLKQPQKQRAKTKPLVATRR